MRPKLYLLHDIPGRMRLYIPVLKKVQNYTEIEKKFSSVKGIQQVRIQPITQTMLIHYKQDEISRDHLFIYLSLFFHQERVPFRRNTLASIKPSVRKGLVRSLAAGSLLLLAYLQKESFHQPTILVYSAVIATGYAVLSHGTHNKLHHPDILIGILSLGSLGPANVLHGAMVTWSVNVLELLHDMREKKTVHSLPL